MRLLSSLQRIGRACGAPPPLACPRHRILVECQLLIALGCFPGGTCWEQDWEAVGATHIGHEVFDTFGVVCDEVADLEASEPSSVAENTALRVEFGTV